MKLRIYLCDRSFRIVLFFNEFLAELFNLGAQVRDIRRAHRNCKQ